MAPCLLLAFEPWAPRVFAFRIRVSGSQTNGNPGWEVWSPEALPNLGRKPPEWAPRLLEIHRSSVKTWVRPIVLVTQADFWLDHFRVTRCLLISLCGSTKVWLQFRWPVIWPRALRKEEIPPFGFWFMLFRAKSETSTHVFCWVLCGGSMLQPKVCPAWSPPKGLFDSGIDPIETHHKWRYATSGPPNVSFPNTNMFDCTMYAKHIHDTMIHISVHAHACTIAMNRLVLRTAPSICRHISSTDDEWSAVRHVTPISGLGNAGRLRRELANPHRGKWS